MNIQAIYSQPGTYANQQQGMADFLDGVLTSYATSKMANYDHTLEGLLKKKAELQKKIEELEMEMQDV